MRTFWALGAASLLQGCALVCLPGVGQSPPQAKVSGQVLAPSAWLDAASAGGPDAPAAGVELVLADASGRALEGSLKAVSDVEGRFTLSPPLGAAAFYVLARGTRSDGQSWRLVALAQAGQQGLVVDWAAAAAAARLALPARAGFLPASASAASALALAESARSQGKISDAPAAPPLDPLAAAAQALPPEVVAPSPEAVAQAPEAPPEALDAFAPIYAPRRN